MNPSTIRRMSSSPINNRSNPPPYYGSTPTAPLLPGPRGAEVWPYYADDNEVQIDNDHCVNGVESPYQTPHYRSRSRGQLVSNLLCLIWKIFICPDFRTRRDFQSENRLRMLI